MSKKPKPVVFRFRNLKLCVFDGGIHTKACFVLERGFRLPNGDKWFNRQIFCYYSDLKHFIELMEEVVRKYEKP